MSPLLISLREGEESLPMPRLDFIERRTQPGDHNPVLPGLRGRGVQRPPTQSIQDEQTSAGHSPDRKISNSRFYILFNESQ